MDGDELRAKVEAVVAREGLGDRFEVVPWPLQPDRQVEVVQVTSDEALWEELEQLRVALRSDLDEQVWGQVLLAVSRGFEGEWGGGFKTRGLSVLDSPIAS